LYFNDTKRASNPKNPITEVSTTIDLSFTSPDLATSATVSTLVNTVLFSDHAPIKLNLCDGMFEISDKITEKFQIDLKFQI
jgi:endonuclease/exonuclease/phosphatase family metal-dependent hydrolase